MIRSSSIQYSAAHSTISLYIYQGVVGVTSAGRGHGSTFFFELPVFGPDYSPPQPIIPQQPQPQPRPKTSSPQLEASPRLLSPSPATIEDGKDDGRYAYTLQPDLEASPSISQADPAASFLAAEQVLESKLATNEPPPCAYPPPVRVLIVVGHYVVVVVVVGVVE